MSAHRLEVIPPVWVPLRHNPQATMRVFCFPYAGAGPTAFSRLAACAPTHWEFVALQLPGRGARLGSVPLHRFDEALDDACAHLGPWFDRPSVFLGHSLGAILAFESARRWLETRSPNEAPRLQALIVSACVAPQHWPTERGRALARLDRPGLVDALRQYNGTPEEVFEDDELLDLLLPTLKADFDLVASYRYRGSAGLTLPLLVMHGADDPYVDGARLAGWRDQTQATSKVICCDGDHFFYESREHDIIQLINDHISTLTSTEEIHST
jgi:medium-chain acyl-[acyl-carrier-protein] hydrolase